MGKNDNLSGICCWANQKRQVRLVADDEKRSDLTI